MYFEENVVVDEFAVDLHSVFVVQCRFRMGHDLARASGKIEGLGSRQGNGRNHGNRLRIGDTFSQLSPKTLAFLGQPL